jgi:iron(III) transport system ATP-binding protein
MIAVMSAGKIEQEGPPREIYQHPKTPFVADFVGSTNFLEAEVLGPGQQTGMRLQTTAGQIEAVCPEGVQVGNKVTVSVRPENVRVSPQRQASVNALEGTVEQVMFLGEYLDARVKVGGTTLFSREHPTVRLRVGDTVWVDLPVDMCAVMSDQHGVATKQYQGEGAVNAQEEVLAS